MDQYEIDCAFCAGRGTDPYDKLWRGATCYVCHGEKTVRVPFPYVACRFCNGSGSYKTFSCQVCRGVGVMALVKEPIKPCPDCAGQGSEQSSGFPCLVCRGRGEITFTITTREEEKV
jgi:DnaJ-class molecular chaperone